MANKIQIDILKRPKLIDPAIWIPGWIPRANPEGRGRQSDSRQSGFKAFKVFKNIKMIENPTPLFDPYFRP